MSQQNWFEDVKAPPRDPNANDTLARELAAASGKTVDDFAFDPKARAEDLEGLDKLRAIADDKLRRTIWDFYWIGAAREKNGDAARERLRARNEWLEKERRKLEELCARAISGGLGRSAQEAARTFLIDPRTGSRRKDVHSMEALRDELKRMAPRKK